MSALKPIASDAWVAVDPADPRCPLCGARVQMLGGPDKSVIEVRRSTRRLDRIHAEHTFQTALQKGAASFVFYPQQGAWHHSDLRCHKCRKWIEMRTLDA